jgi:hypothetical protein
MFLVVLLVVVVLSALGGATALYRSRERVQWAVHRLYLSAKHASLHVKLRIVLSFYQIIAKIGDTYLIQ